MNESKKTFKKCTVYYKIEDYSKNPPKTSEGIRSETIYNEEEDVMTFKEYDDKGRIMREEIIYDDKTQTTEYDQDGNRISDELCEYELNDAGDQEEIISDLEGNICEERLEYDNKGRVSKKLFIENGNITSFIEFEYDDKDRAIKSKGFDKGKPSFIFESRYENDDETSTMQFDGNGNLQAKSVVEVTQDGLTRAISKYDNSGNLIKRIEEDRDEEDNLLEQRVFNHNNQLKQKTIFGDDNDFGFRTSLEEEEYENGKLVKKVFTKYNYEY